MATFRNAPRDAAASRNERQATERSENHTLTVKEVARMFESARAARIERTIVNWCWPNKHGVSRLDAYLDPNEGKWLITPQSVDRAVKEEIAKANRRSPPSEPVENVRAEAKRESERTKPETADAPEIKELQQKVFDLQVLNMGKDYTIGILKEEREKQVQDLMEASRRVGQLETKLLQLEGPKANPSEVKRVQVVSETEYSDSDVQGELA